MAKLRIGDKESTNDNGNYLPPFKQRPKSKKGLFDGFATGAELTISEAAYFKCVEALNGKQNIKILVTDISSFFNEECIYLHGCKSLDANHFNMVATWKAIMQIYGLNELEVLQLVAKMFSVFENLRIELNLTDKVPSVSLFKRQFIVEKLIDYSGKKFNTFY